MGKFRKPITLALAESIAIEFCIRQRCGNKGSRSMEMTICYN